MYKKACLIAEAGCNHMGNMKIAKEMIDIAASFCKADAIKFQKRCPKELLTEEQYNKAHPNPDNSFGRTYGEHREALEFSLEQHKQLKVWCEIAGITYACSVWDMTSAREIASLNPEFIKIPSACNNNFEMLDWLCDNYRGKIQVSIGMTTRDEEEEIVTLFNKKGRGNDLTLFACTSGYPVPFCDVCLLEIKRIQEKYVNKIENVGFSGHHSGIAVDIAAYTLGASIIERHYTLNRTWKGTDHAASLEPDGIRKLKRDLNAAYNALRYKDEELLTIEKEQRIKLKYRSKEKD